MGSIRWGRVVRVPPTPSIGGLPDGLRWSISDLESTSTSLATWEPAETNDLPQPTGKDHHTASKYPNSISKWKDWVDVTWIVGEMFPDVFGVFLEVLGLFFGDLGFLIDHFLSASSIYIWDILFFCSRGWEF